MSRTPFRDLTGERFGAVEVLRRENNAWTVRCDCGRTCAKDSRQLLDKTGLKSCLDPTCPHYIAARMASRGVVDITGQRFGHLTVIGPHGSLGYKTRKLLWSCRCDCGKIVERTAPALRAHPASAFCGACKSWAVTVGQRLGWLVVQAVTGGSTYDTQVAECLCDCGTVTTKRAATLRQYPVPSCGCHRRQVLREFGSKWEYEGKTYTITELAAHCGVNRTTLDQNLRRLGSAEAAIRSMRATSEKLRPLRRFCLHGVMLSTTKLATLSGIKRCTIIFRLRRGWTPEDAIRPLLTQGPS